MKIHPVNFMIAVAVSALVAYGLWSIDGPLKNFVAVGSFVFFCRNLDALHGNQLRTSEECD